MSVVFRYIPPKVDARLLLAAAGTAAVEAAAQHILAVSQPLVPVDTGALKASGHVDMAAPHHARIIYAAESPEGYAYGLRQHEDLSLHHPNGGQAKFLEAPMHSEAQKAAEILAAGLRKVLG